MICNRDLRHFFLTSYKANSCFVVDIKKTEMELRIDVTPSSSNGYGLSANSPYRVVDFREIIFPSFQQIKRLGRGSYGTVIQAKFENHPVAVIFCLYISIMIL